ASSGGRMQFSYGTISNMLGTIRALNGSTVEVFGATIVGGTLTNTAGGFLRASGNGGVLERLNQRGQFEVPDGTFVGLRGTITNSGTILLSASGGSADLHIAGGATLTGGGTINMGTNANARAFGAVSLDTLINLDNTMQGAAQIGVGIIGLDNGGTFISNQPIKATIY